MLIPGLTGCLSGNGNVDVQKTVEDQEIAINSDDNISARDNEYQDNNGGSSKEDTIESSKEQKIGSDSNEASTPGTDNNNTGLETNELEDVPEADDIVEEGSGETPATSEEPQETAPGLTLNIVLGPEYAQDNQVCYYRIKAGVSGIPFPEITFSKDDSNGAWGRDVAQINLTEGQSYTLTCRAENIAGTAESAIVLNWIENPDARVSNGKNQVEPSIQVDYGDIENFLIDVNLSMQQVTVSYKGSVIKNMVCSSGRPETPTPQGEYVTYQKIYYQYVSKFAQGAFYWTRFYGSYLFHGIPTDINRNMLAEEYEKLGTPASHGCIRLMNEDAKWMYEILPLGIRVNIHN